MVSMSTVKFKVMVESTEFRIQGVGFRVWGLGFGVQGLGFGVWASGHDTCSPQPQRDAQVHDLISRV